MIAFRDYHGTTHENGALNPRVETENGLTTIKPYEDLPALHFAHDAAAIDTNVERELLTPCGLRTLSPTDANYIGRYKGDPRSRDGAYHQGTVWPWLMGPFITAYVKTFGRKAGQDFANEWLSQFQAHLDKACLGQVSEIFDGDAPRGCVAQAWSVAELLRAATENIYSTIAFSQSASGS